MKRGLLEVRGELDRAQFWPVGGSDADTSKVLVKVDDSSFRFRKDAAAKWRVTHAFEGARVVGRTTKDAISAKHEIVARLQGIDAPELHYRPASELRDKPKKAGEKARTAAQREAYLKYNEEYRQPLAEAATMALASFLGGTSGKIACVVRTEVDHPNEVFDTYGRFVGELFVKRGGKEVSVNRWLVRQGWAVPAFYNSMSDEQIAGLTEDGDAAWEEGLGVWAGYEAKVGSFEWGRVYRGKGAEVQSDTGAVIAPKLFRRQAAWAVNKRAKMVSGGFHAYLKRKGDPCFRADEYREQGDAAERIEFSELVGADGTFSVWPEQVVYVEAPSRLVREGEVVGEW